MKLLKACLALVPGLFWTACHTSGDLQPIVIDLSAPTETPAATTPTPGPRPPSPTPTLQPPPPSPTPAPRIAAAPPPEPSTPMQPAPVPPPDVRAARPGSPEAVVQSRIDAYNGRDLEKLLSLYAADARVFDPPDRLRDSGSDQVRQSYARRFASGARTRIETSGRMTSGNFVVERETESGASGPAESSIVISEVLGGKIVRVWILR